jgi:hypothetical protein
MASDQCRQIQSIQIQQAGRGKMAGRCRWREESVRLLQLPAASSDFFSFA